MASSSGFPMALDETDAPCEPCHDDDVVAEEPATLQETCENLEIPTVGVCARAILASVFSSTVIREDTIGGFKKVAEPYSSNKSIAAALEITHTLAKDQSDVEYVINELLGMYSHAYAKIMATRSTLFNRLSRDTSREFPVDGEFHHVYTDGSTSKSKIGATRIKIYMAWRVLSNWTWVINGDMDMDSHTWIEKNLPPAHFDVLGRELHAAMIVMYEQLVSWHGPPD
jgi:hypothetical protein